MSYFDNNMNCFNSVEIIHILKVFKIYVRTTFGQNGLDNCKYIRPLYADLKLEKEICIPLLIELYSSRS